MPRLLPLKIQIEILSHIEWDGWTPDDDSQTLASCRLVCKAWCGFCQRKLLRTVFIFNHERLESLVASLSSATRVATHWHPISTCITQLDLDDDMCHVAPFYLATKLHSLQRLRIWRHENDTPFVIRSSLLMHLKHFRSVTELRLDDIMFQSFWEFCRLIVALPALSYLGLHRVDLLDPNPFQRLDGRAPSLFTFPQSLTELRVRVLSGWNPLWIWTTPLQTRRWKLANSHSRPFLTLHDADTIWESAKSVSVDNGDYGIDSHLEWSFDEGCQLWSLVWSPFWLSHDEIDVNYVDTITFTLGVPQQPHLPFQPKFEGTFLSWAVHPDHVPDNEESPEEPRWEIMDGHFHHLKNLRSLQFSLLSAHPDFHGKEKLWVQRIASHLLLLQTRENFTLTFAVGGKVVPWIVIPPRPLPFELHLEVLKYLVSDIWKSEDRARTLATCSLVCWDWCRLCQRNLLKTISLRSRRQLGKLVTSLSSATHPIGIHVVELSLAGEDIHHVAPLYLITKLPFLKRLVIDRDTELDDEDSELDVKTTPKLYPVHSSLVMHLNHFKTLTELSLSNVTFQLFWDFRRFVVALPALSNLHLDNVSLPHSDPFSGRVPSLYSAPQSLTYLSLRCNLDWNPLWIWVIPVQPRPWKPRNPGLHPLLTPHDAETIWRLAELDRRLGDCFFDWSYNEEHQQWSLMSAPWLYDDSELIPRPLDFVTSLSKELSFSFESQARLQQSSLTSAIYWCSPLQSKDGRESFWSLLDMLYNSLESLRALQIDLQCDSSWPGTFTIARVEKISWFLPSLRAREGFMLTFVLEGNIIPWLATPPHPLPLKVQTLALSHLIAESRAWKEKERTRSLSACGLVCKVWFDICYRELSRILSIRTPRQLESLVATLSSSATRHVGTFITELSFIAASNITNPSHHIAPFYLATKLPSLRYLVIDGGNIPNVKDLCPVFPSLIARVHTKLRYYVHSSLDMHFKHFRTVTQLKLSNLTFQSFWDFRRLIVALSALSNLHIAHIDLPGSDPFQRLEGRVLSLFAVPKNLVYFSFDSLDWNPLWIWVVPSQTRPRKTKYLNSHLHPFLTPHDANTIWELARLGGWCPDGFFDWSYDEWYRQWRLVYLASQECNQSTKRIEFTTHAPELPHQESSSLHSISGHRQWRLVYVERERGQSTERIRFLTRAQQPSFSLHPVAGEPPLTSAIHDINYLGDGEFLHWDMVDALHYSLENLRALRINVLSLTPVRMIDSKEEMVKQIVHHLPLLRSRHNFSLTVSVEGELIPWETLGDEFSGSIVSPPMVSIPPSHSRSHERRWSI